MAAASRHVGWWPYDPVRVTQKEPVSRTRKRRGFADGNDLLYHYFQKTLLTEDAEQFRLLTARLIVGLAVWLPRTAYRRYPLLVPYAVRDPTCRGNARRSLPDQWGAPDAQGHFRDDNSLVKAFRGASPSPIQRTSSFTRNDSAQVLSRRMSGENSPTGPMLLGTAGPIRSCQISFGFPPNCRN
jgi:hypothetical protein